MKPRKDLDNRGVLAEFLDFFRANTRWWLACLVVVVLMLGILVLLGRTNAAPFIYTVR